MLHFLFFLLDTAFTPEVLGESNCFPLFSQRQCLGLMSIITCCGGINDSVDGRPDKTRCPPTELIESERFLLPRSATGSFTPIP